MSDDRDDIVKTVERIRKKYKTELDSEPHKAEMGFLDEINSLIRGIFKDNPTDVYTVFTPEALERWKKRKWRRLWGRLFSGAWIRKALMFLLLVTITGFLVSEALSFYAVDGIISQKVYVKAILTELCFIFLSAYRSVGKIMTLAVTTLRAAIFALMLFVISSNVLFVGAQTESDIKNIASQIQLVEQQIQEKERLIKFYREKNWGINVRLQEEAKEKLVAKLIELKERQIQEQKGEEVAGMVKYKSYGRAIFRVILLFISVLITRRLFTF